LVAGSVKRYFKNNGKYIKDAYGTSQYMEAFGGYDTSIVANVNAVAEYSKTIMKRGSLNLTASFLICFILLLECPVRTNSHSQCLFFLLDFKVVLLFQDIAVFLCIQVH
jgi:hypothetical protein